VEDASVEIPSQVTVRLDWSAAEDAPISHANQILTQVGPPLGNSIPDGAYITLGSVKPPVIPADESGRAERVQQLTGSTVPVTVYGRFHVSRAFIDDLIKVLQITADQYDAAVAVAEQQRQES
jgi:hypothetical protein